MSEIADLKAEIAKLQAAPLCSGHAAAWYTSRDNIHTDSGCIWCDLEARIEDMRERAAKEAEICGSTRAAERIRALPTE